MLVKEATGYKVLIINNAEYNNILFKDVVMIKYSEPIYVLSWFQRIIQHNWRDSMTTGFREISIVLFLFLCVCDNFVFKLSVRMWLSCNIYDYHGSRWRLNYLYTAYSNILGPFY